MKSSDVIKVLDLLKEAYPDAKCALNHENVFQLLVSTVLSAQTTDKRVNLVAPNLYEAYPDAAALAEANPGDVAEYIKSIGIYRNKSKNIVSMAKVLCERFGGAVPGNYEDLVSLPGVGRKTANVVLADGFGIPRIAVDTHVFRVANRTGIARGDNVLTTEEDLMRNIPEERWTEAHHTIICHGRGVCKAGKPGCGACVLAGVCERNGM